MLTLRATDDPCADRREDLSRTWTALEALPPSIAARRRAFEAFRRSRNAICTREKFAVAAINATAARVGEPTALRRAAQVDRPRRTALDNLDRANAFEFVGRHSRIDEDCLHRAARSLTHKATSRRFSGSDVTSSPRASFNRLRRCCEYAPNTQPNRQHLRGWVTSPRRVSPPAVQCIQNANARRNRRSCRTVPATPASQARRLPCPPQHRRRTAAPVALVVFDVLNLGMRVRVSRGRLAGGCGVA